MLRLFIVVLTVNTLWFSTVAAAPSADLWPRWQASSPGSTQLIDHTLWDRLLKHTWLLTIRPELIVSDMQT